MPKENDGKQDAPGGQPENADVKALREMVQSGFAKLTSDLQNGLNGQRSMYDRQIGAIRQQLQGRGTAEGSYDRPYNRESNDRGADNQESETERVMAETDRFERARDRFERNHPQYRSNDDLRKRVDSIMNDQSRRAELLTRDDFGRISYDRAYRTAYLEARDQIATEAEAAAATARAQAETERRQSKADAALSGDVAEELPEGLTLDAVLDMSPEDMEKRGLVPGVKAHKPVVGV